VVRRTHYCRRCGAAIDPGDVYSAVDVLDAEGRLRELLCRRCGGDLRAFLDEETASESGGETTDEPTDENG
jgi:hypothetical protein